MKWAIAVVAISCGAPQHGATPPGVTVKTYGPLGIRTDAKAPNQAVILGTDTKDGSTVLPLPAAQARANVDAMFVKLGDAPTGGLTPVKLATAPNPEGSVQVGIFEEMAGGTGPQWRAGVWVSAIVAASVLDKDLTDFTFSASSGGYIDGASASGLMAGGFLAAMTGAPVDPAATMTGTINPDGTIGPVAGIPEKFLGSIEKGKKKLGYPIGMRMAKSEASGKVVDLEQLAKEHGAQAIEIADIHEAYQLLTGKQLPEPVPVAEADMALDPATSKALAAKYAGWQKRLADKWATLVQLDTAGRLPPTLVAMRDLTKHQVEAAERLHKQGRDAGAFVRVATAMVYASATVDTYELVTKVQAADLASADAMLAALAKRAHASVDVLDQIGALRPTTLGGHLTMMAAFKTALEGWVSATVAERTVTAVQEALKSLAGKSKAELGAPGLADGLASGLAPAAVFTAAAELRSEVARQELEIEAVDSVSYMCSVPNVRRMATSFQSASAAALNYFDTLLVEPLAQSAKISADEARERVAFAEPDYLVAWMTSRLATSDGLPKQLAAKWGEQSLAWGLASLAGSELAYYDSATLITKYYSLGVHKDDGGKITSLDSDKAFDHMLATAERTARASARAARIATGAIPVQAKLAYQAALVEREGDLSDKLDALAQMWVSSAMSQTAVMLARN
jgi:hypothetical protein